jgi:sulfate adenylyltransferase subunit 2
LEYYSTETQVVMSQQSIHFMDELEAEAMFVIREVFAEFNNPVILFSGGKDSITLTHLAVKAFYPLEIPFSLLHIDTGHNFQETIDFRNDLVRKFGINLIVGSVQDSINQGRVIDETGEDASRNTLQIRTLLDTISEYEIDCAIGGGRRDEEKSRAKERFFSHRNISGNWDPRNQRPELWQLFNTRHHEGEHFRVFPISNWTEADIWAYLGREKIELPSLYFAHEREVIYRNNSWIPNSEYLQLRAGETVVKKKIRFRTLGDITITGGVESEADTVEKVIREVQAMRQTERGNRADDKRSDSAMEDRKRKGYF